MLAWAACGTTSHAPLDAAIDAPPDARALIADASDDGGPEDGGRDANDDARVIGEAGVDAGVDVCEGLDAALAAAAPGDVVTVRRSCSPMLAGRAITVPAGVTLRADHVRTEPFDVRIAGAGVEPAVTLVPSDDPLVPTRISGVEVSSPGRAAIVVRGEGHARIDDVRVLITAGIGVGVERATVSIEGSAIHSDFSPARRDEEPVPADAARVGTWGVVARDAADVTITDTGMSSFANGCTAVIGATVRVTRGRFFVCRTHGVLAYGGTVELADSQLDNLYASTGGTSRGLVVAGGAMATVTGLDAFDDEGDAVFVDAASASLTTLTTRALGGAGVWAQRAASVSIGGASMIEGARGGGVVAIGASEVNVRDTTVRAVASAMLPRAGGGSAAFGDGISIVGIVMPPTVQITDVVLDGNARVGLLVDGGGLAIPTLTLLRIDARGTGAQLGAVAQNVMSLPPAWDMGVMRTGSPATLDAAAGVLDVAAPSAGIVMPPTISF